ncbi:hypothetical protein OH77DRAFT_1412659, partial [Trametes cingulata]
MAAVYSPNPGTYAVVRMDPVAMVQNSDDQDAVAAASAMKPKRYLVYIQSDLELPFPHRPWYCYRVWPIAPFVRPRDEAAGVTSDMCTPIFPNMYHPTRRAPLRTEPPFPFDNCYHWSGTSLAVRVRAR